LIRRQEGHHHIPRPAPIAAQARADIPEREIVAQARAQLY
jgi:hypothetical protein